jgi:hypothetical protein
VRVIFENELSIKPYTGFAKCATCRTDTSIEPLQQITFPNGQRLVLCADGLALVRVELGKI